MQPSANDPTENADNIEKHFPNTARLLHEREAKSESPARSRGESLCEHTDDDANHAEDDEAAARLQERLARASERRDKLLEARRLAQAEASAHRKQKLEQVASLRLDAVRTFITKAPALISTLLNTGLNGNPTTTPEIVEQILIADPRVCSLCGGAQPLPAVCPQNQKPHRRSLVVLSELLLKMIGNTKVNLSPPKAEEGASNDSEVVAPRARRGIRVQPHLFVLAYYYAAMPTGVSPQGADVLLQLSASHLVALVGQLFRLCIEASVSASSAQRGVQLVSELLTSFAKTWRQYAKLADAHSRPSDDERDPASRRKVVDELVQTTTDAVVAATVSLATAHDRTSQDAEAILSFVDLMYMRLREIGGVDAVEQARMKSESAVAEATRATQPQDHASSDASTQRSTHDLSTPPRTPESKPQRVRNTVVPLAAPLRLPSSYVGTSSDTDSKGDATTSAAQQQVVYGPGLPPNWFVDAQGVSRPPSAAVANALYGDKRQRLEVRARTAFQTKLRLADPPSQEETATEKLISEMRDLALQKLKSDLNQSPPDLTRLPGALTSIADALVEALPPKLRTKIGKEIKDVLDWSAVRRNVRHSENNIAELMRYVVTRVIELGMPARDAALRQECSELEARLNSREDPLGDIVSDMFRFMLTAIRQLRVDISTFTLSMISDELAKHAEEYHAELLTECFPQPSRWSKTIEFFQDALSGDTQEVKSFLEKNKVAMSSVASTPVERVLRAALFLGSLELLRSANRSADDRWALFPSESMLVEKQQLFDAANTVQQDTLSLMLSGVASMILQSKKLKERTTLTTLLTALDAKLRGEFLTNATSISHLQELILTEIDFFLGDDTFVSSPTSLSAPERAVLSSMIEKMTDTKTTQYATFEGRVITAVLNALSLEPREAQSIPVAQRPRTIGLASDSSFKNGAKLRCVLDYHWNVLRPFYVDMSRHLQISDDLLLAAEL
ncbi:Hypothetical protein, putative [Bodo saltans]|uniref:Uncharacterized protein n=1 Tax=Bodo saltans TaxID=75058 RepID=A0A0S4JLJ6_BODSA|nr:Hypothetical protein, putative [Bodo saltans]|eukprot:CUG91049.1 Hypothetical protein, putative [Bodo saltans]